MTNETTTKSDVERYLEPLEPGEQIDPAHRDWMDAQTRKTLEAAKDSRDEYKSLDEIRAKFGFNAR